MVDKASIHDFKNQRNKLPGDREGITAVGPYVLELYFDPLGMRPMSKIEINKLGDDGEYSKVTTVNFNPDTEDCEERCFEDPESAARDAFNDMRSSVQEVESYL